MDLADKANALPLRTFEIGRRRFGMLLQKIVFEKLDN